jgi:hypothetical protein
MAFAFCFLLFSVSGSVVQTYLEAVLECTLVPHATALRRAALEVVAVGFRQGLVYPFMCVAHLIALSTDTTLAIRDSAMSLIKEIDDRNDRILQNKFAEGLRQSFLFQRDVLLQKMPSGK